MGGISGIILIPKLANEERALLRQSGAEYKPNKFFVDTILPSLSYCLNCTVAQLLDLQCWLEDNLQEIDPPAFPQYEGKGGIAGMEVQQTCITVFGLYYDQVHKLLIKRNASNDAYLVQVLFIYILTLFY